jgi:cell volume regulation protein A
MNPSLSITFLGVIFLLGIFISIISSKLKIPNMLLLILAGFLISIHPYIIENNPMSIEVVATIGVLSLILIVFDSTSRIKLKEFDKLSFDATRLTTVCSLMLIVIIGLMMFFLFGVSSLPIAFIFASLLIGSDPSAIANLIKVKQNKSLRLLLIESIFNSPLTVVIPLIFVDYIRLVPGVSMNFFDKFLLSFIAQVIAGIGAGFVVGIVIFKLMRNKYSEKLSPVAIFTAAILSYSLAELVNGSGVFAVTTLGLFFGNAYFKNKDLLQHYSSVVSEIMQILVFVLIGFVFSFRTITAAFVLKLLLIFSVLCLVRLFAVLLVFRKSSYTQLEKLFLTFSFPKGIAAAVAIIAVQMTGLVSVELINLAIGVLFLSVVFSTISIKVLSKKIIDYSKVVPKEQAEMA